MQHFPIFVSLEGRRVILGGGGAAAIAKLRLLLKTSAHLTVFAEDPAPEIRAWADQGRLRLVRRSVEPGDALCAVLAYGAHEDHTEDARFRQLAQSEGALVNIVDNLETSQFITPAIVDRDPVVVAIGTEGAAPVLARSIKRDLEEQLSATLGRLARIAKHFRHAAERLAPGAPRRAFWAEYFARTGPRVANQGDGAITAALNDQLTRHLAETQPRGEVVFIGAGPGDPELLTLKARKALDRADVVIHDGLVSPEILELARREAEIISVAKQGFGPSTPQDEINRLITDHVARGAMVVRLKGGDTGVFGRLDEELEAVCAAGQPYSVIPGITAASAAVASIGQSLTKRHRNADLRMLTGHDMQGFAEQDWRGLARDGAVAAIYMGKRAARFIAGRLIMHGASANTPVTLVENASRADQHVVATTLAELPDAVRALNGPVVTLLGLSPREAQSHLAESPLMQEHG